MYHLQSKQCVRSYTIDNVNEATDMYFHGESNKVWISKKSGKIDVVDWRELPTNEGAVVTTDVQRSIAHIVDVSANENRILAISQQAFTLSLVELSRESPKEKWSYNTIVKLTDNNIFAVSASKEYFGFYSPIKDGKKILTFIQLSNGNNRTVICERKLERSAPAVSMAISDEGVVAVGSVKGPIELYYDVFNPSSSITTKILKWHADAVFALEFALDGTYLLSGGRERVLVLWHLEDGQNQFLPRLENEIKHISVSEDSGLYALNLGMSEILVLSAIDLVSRLLICGVKAKFSEVPADAQSEKVRLTSKGRTFEDEPIRDFSTLMYLDPRTKNLYLPTDERSHVQVFDPHRGEQVSVFSVASAVQTGKVAIERQMISDPIVTHLAFSKDEEWMATVDVNLPPEVDDLLSKRDYEINMKLWRRGRDHVWELVTRISSPHGNNQQIASLSAVSDGFVTLSESGSIRLWKKGLFNEEQGQVSWSAAKVVASVAEGVGSVEFDEINEISGGKVAEVDSTKFLQKYTNRKIKLEQESAVAITFSEDGSLFVVGKKSNLYLYDAQNYSFLVALPNLLGSDVVALDFILDSILVCLSTTRLVLYDLVNECQLWSAEISVPALTKNTFAVDRANGKIAIAINHYQKNYHIGSLLCILGTESSIPLHVKRLDRSPIASVKHVPNSSSFVFMDVNGHITETRPSSSATALERQARNTVHETFSAQIAEWNSERRKQAKTEAEFTRALAEQGGQNQVLNINSFDAAFADQTASLTTLFNRVMRVVSTK